MPQFKLLITDHPWPGIEIEQRRLEPLGVRIVDPPQEDEATLARLAVDVDAIATCWAKVTAKVIESAVNCRIVCRMGIGLDNIHIPTATARGIPVTNVPDYCVEEVADHALGLLLGLARNVAFFHLRTKRMEYNLKAGPPMHRLRGRTLGIIGFGRIGQELFQRAKALEMNVIATSRSGDDRGSGCRMVSVDEILKLSDVISLHAPLNFDTKHILNRRAFEQMKPGVLIINTSRGGLINAAALWNAIQNGIVAGAGLDVFEPEPPDLSEPLYQDERVITTPHAAFVSVESLIELRERVADQIADMLTGKTPQNIVNPEWMEQKRSRPE